MSFSILGLGLLLGMKHAFDADHIAAVAAMPSKKSSFAGMFWGFGHTISLLIVGLIVLVYKIPIPEYVSLSLEFIVSIMLVILGINVLYKIRTEKIHAHKHKHGNHKHLHFHSHKLTKNHGHNHIKNPLIVGLVHGLAGSAALTLLVLTTIDSIILGLFYILLFGAGSIIGMTLISSIISLPFKLIPNRLTKTRKLLRVSAGSLSILIGLSLMTTILGAL